MSRNWSDTGANVGGAVINAGAGFASGIFGAVKGIGNRISRTRNADFIETFCAVLGDVASQNGNFKQEEKDGIREFLLKNRDVSALASYETDELTAKIEDYAIAAFTGNREKIVTAIQGLDHGGDSAKMVIIAALAVAFADGECDADEAKCVTDYANQLGVNVTELGAECNLPIPDLSAAALPAPAAAPVAPTPPPAAPVAPVAPPAPVAASKPCGMCDGSGKKSNGSQCPFCGGTGQTK